MLEDGPNISSSFLPILLLVISMAMSIVLGLKLRWFRARMNMGSSRDRDGPISVAGVYRSQTELPSAYNSVYRSQPLETTSRPNHTVPMKSERSAEQQKQPSSNHVPRNLAKQQAPPAPNKNFPSETRDEIKVNGHVSPSQPSQGNQPTHRNPLMLLDYDTVPPSNAVPAQSLPPAVNGQSKQQKKKAPAPKGILQKQRAPPPPSMDDDDFITFEQPPPMNREYASNLKLSTYEDQEESET